MQINSYFSRDAGVTWNEIRKGAWVPEFGDHGGVIVLADTQQLTNNFMYLTLTLTFILPFSHLFFLFESI
jgi:hypothetical protein